jgi:hypothetical protein
MATVEQLRIKDTVNQLYKELDSAIISLTFGKMNEDDDTIKASQNKIDKTLRKVYNGDDETFDAFVRLVLAEYKEKIYDNIYDACYDNVEGKILMEYHQLITEDAHLYDVHNHQHDPTHYMFNDDKHFYSFYEMVESNGGSILEEWEM